jgi:ADP-ribosylglycohydrolase
VISSDTVPFVIWCATRHLDDFEAALWETVEGLGDRDTTCAMVGGIVGARLGIDAIPEPWLRSVEAWPGWSAAEPPWPGAAEPTRLSARD